MKWKLDRVITAGIALTLAMGLVGCGSHAEVQLPDVVRQDNMLPEDQWDSVGGGTRPSQSDTGGTGLDIEANTGVWDSLMASYDRSTAVDIGADAGGEFGAMFDDHIDYVESTPVEPDSDETYGQGHTPVDVAQEPVPAAQAPLPTVLNPVASGTATFGNSNCVIDYSNSKDGYFMSRWLASPQKIKIQSTGPSGATYTYNLSGNDWSAFPFSDGNGTYNIRVMQNVGGSKYAIAGQTAVDVTMTDEFAPFIRPNQYVNYENAPVALAKASEVCTGVNSELEKVAAIYDWVVANLTYDHDKARTVQSDYLPDLDNIMSLRKGICFDYAALMSGMLRSQGVACRLVVGYAGQAYHAWISVYVPGQGWIDGVVFFDGTHWQRMDPTFASSSGGSAEIMAYIGDGSNYAAKYLY